MPKMGICPLCNQGPRRIASLDPITGEHICQQCRKKRPAKKVDFRLSKHPGKEKLKELLREHRGIKVRIRKSLKGQGIEVGLSTISRWIARDEELSELDEEIEEARMAAYKQRQRERAEVLREKERRERREKINGEKLQTLRLITQGWSEEKIAGQLNISIQKIRGFITPEICRDLGINYNSDPASKIKMIILGVKKGYCQKLNILNLNGKVKRLTNLLGISLVGFREEIVRLIDEGLRVEDIALRLRIEERGVKESIASINQKLDESIRVSSEESILPPTLEGAENDHRRRLALDWLEEKMLEAKGETPEALLEELDKDPMVTLEQIKLRIYVSIPNKRGLPFPEAKKRHQQELAIAQGGARE